VNEAAIVGDGLWPVFWAATALTITGMAAWGSTMLMRLIDDRIETSMRQVLNQVDRLSHRLAILEDEMSLEGPDTPAGELGAGDAQPSDEVTAQGQRGFV